MQKRIGESPDLPFRPTPSGGGTQPLITSTIKTTTTASNTPPNQSVVDGNIASPSQQQSRQPIIGRDTRSSHGGIADLHMLTHIVDLIRQWRFWKQKRRRERERQRRTISYEYLPTAAQLYAMANGSQTPSTSSADPSDPSSVDPTTTTAGGPTTLQQTLNAQQYLDLANAYESIGLVEEELQQMQKTVAVLLNKLRTQPDDVATSPEDECVGCVTGRASMQTYPCAHRVLCRKCFIRTIQVAVNDRNLPLRCVLCRSRIVRLKCQNPGKVDPNRAACHMSSPPGLVRPANSAHPLSGVLQPAYL